MDLLENNFFQKTQGLLSDQIYSFAGQEDLEPQ